MGKGMYVTDDDDFTARGQIIDQLLEMFGTRLLTEMNAMQK